MFKFYSFFNNVTRRDPRDNDTDMLLQDYLYDATAGIFLLSVFPAVPDAWSDVVFYRLRALGGVLVSARRARGQCEWIQLETESPGPIVVCCLRFPY